MRSVNVPTRFDFSPSATQPCHERTYRNVEHKRDRVSLSRWAATRRRKREVALVLKSLFGGTALLACVLLSSACVPTVSQPVAPAAVPITVETTAPAAPRPQPVPARPARAQPSADLLNAVQALGSTFKGEVGISVRDIDEGWVVAWEGDRPRPQLSVS